MADVLHVKPTESSAPHAETFDLDAKYTTEEGRIFLTGIQALVRVPLDHIRADRKAGRTTMGYISGYPGSPLGGFDSELIARRKLLDAHGVVHQSGLNEELGATAVMGSQEAAKFGKLKGDSVIGIWYGKAPGLDRSGDALRHAPYFAPTYGNGALAYVGDDPGDKSSTLPSGSIQTMANLCMAVLYPGNPQEVLDFGRHGLMLSRECGIWSGIKVDTAIADGSGTAEVSPDRIRAELEAVKEIIGRAPAFMGRSAMHPMVSAEREIHDYRLEAARAYGALNGLNAVTHDAPDATLGIMAPGHTYYALIEALHTIGLGEAELRRFGIKIMRIGMVYPLDNDAVRGFARGLDELLVVEEKRPYIEELTRAALYGMTEGPRLVTGKRDASGELLVPSFGWLDADALVEPLVRRITERVDSSQLRMPEPPSRQRISLPVIPRTPYFCSGCPHNTSLKVPDDSKVSGGIGCHSMITFLDRERSGDFMGFTQMGGEGVHWAGIAPFVDTDHIFQNLGDGTYFHSGQLCVQAAVAAGVNITYKLLYNRAVAMTGGQDVVGELEVPEMVRVLMLQGVKHIIITTEDRGRYRGVKLPAGVDVWDRERIVEAQERLREIQGVTVLIHDQQCAAEARRLRKRGQLPEPATTVVIAERVCEGCGDCGVYSNCLSLQPIDTEFGEKTSIDQTSCNKDYSCLHGDCPSFITLVPRKDTKLSRALGRAAATRTEPSRPETLGNDIPEPTPVVPVDDFTVRMPGIGGTGVVTVAQVLGTAAMLDGRFVNSLDQTGLSQKGGAVISDVRITTSPVEGANKLAAGMLDVYLVFDLVGALSPSNLDAASASRTVAVVSTTKSATGLMIGRPTMHQPSEAAMRGVIDGVTRAEHPRALRSEHVGQHARPRRRLPGRCTAHQRVGDRAGDRAQRRGGRDQHAGVPLGPDAHRRPRPPARGQHPDHQRPARGRPARRPADRRPRRG
jgi:indolepyruvate ferredoxin oxidoreductase